MSGYGTVGRGFADVLEMRRDSLAEQFGKENLPRIVCVMDSKTVARDPNGLDMKALEKRKLEKGTVGDETYSDSLSVMDSVGFDLLIEVSPTNIKDGGDGLRNIRHALERGKDVITVNKGPLALCFAELIKLATDNGCKLKFEGSVGGAMPIINLCHNNLAGENIRSIRGIFNGTCNYILSKMDNGQPFEQALKEAQQRALTHHFDLHDFFVHDFYRPIVGCGGLVFRIGRGVAARRRLHPVFFGLCVKLKIPIIVFKQSVSQKDGRESFFARFFDPFSPIVIIVIPDHALRQALHVKIAVCPLLGKGLSLPAFPQAQSGYVDLSGIKGQRRLPIVRRNGTPDHQVGTERQIFKAEQLFPFRLCDLITIRRVLIGRRVFRVV